MYQGGKSISLGNAPNSSRRLSLTSFATKFYSCSMLGGVLSARAKTDGEPQMVFVGGGYFAIAVHVDK